MPDSMTVRLHLYRIRVVAVLVDLPERLEVLVRDLRSVVRCPWCGFKTSKVHETRRVRITDVPRGRQKVTLIWLPGAFSYSTQQVTTEVYTHLFPEELEGLRAKLDEIYGDLLE